MYALSGRSSVWPECLAWNQEVEGSNPSAQTIKSNKGTTCHFPPLIPRALKRSSRPFLTRSFRMLKWRSRDVRPESSSKTPSGAAAFWRASFAAILRRLPNSPIRRTLE